MNGDHTGSSRVFNMQDRYWPPVLMHRDQELTADAHTFTLIATLSIKNSSSRHSRRSITTQTNDTKRVLEDKGRQL